MPQSTDEMELEQDDMALDQETPSLLSLPIELLFKIANKEAKIMASLSNTCNQFGFFQQQLAAKRLAHYIEADPDPVKAKAMVKANLNLLFVAIDKVVNKNTNQTHLNVKPLQLAFCEGDDEMCLMLESCFELACGSKEAGREEICKQLHEKFAEGSDKQAESKEVRKNRLATVIQTIANEQFNNGCDDVPAAHKFISATNRLILSEETLIAIEKFRNEFDDSQPKIIQSDIRFHFEILQELLDSYAEASRQWAGHPFFLQKCALLEDAVISFVLGYAPKNEAQKFNQGIAFLQQGEEFKRARINRDGEDFYVTLRKASPDFHLSGSYFDITRGWHSGRSSRWMAELGHHMLSIAWHYRNLCRAKTSNLQGLCSRAQSENISVRKLSM